MVATEVHGLSLDGMVDMEAAAAHVPGDVVLIGNLDPVRVMLSGSTDFVRAEVRRLVDSMTPHPNFLLSTGCDSPQETPLENIVALVDETRAYTGRGFGIEPGFADRVLSH